MTGGIGGLTRIALAGNEIAWGRRKRQQARATRVYNHTRPFDAQELATALPLFMETPAAAPVGRAVRALDQRHLGPVRGGPGPDHQGPERGSHAGQDPALFPGTAGGRRREG